MRLWNVLAMLVAASSFGIAAHKVQSPPTELNITVIERAEEKRPINDLRRRTSREPIVQVTDQNRRPVAGAAVSFELPTTGAGGAFKGGNSLKVMTNAKGVARAAGFRPNAIAGSFQIHVTATFQHVVGTAVIAQTNAASGAGAMASSAGAVAGSSGTGSGAGGGAAAGGGTAGSTGASTAASAAGTTAGAGTGAGAVGAVGGAVAGTGVGISTTAAIGIGAGVTAVTGAAVAVKVATSSPSSSTSQTSGTISSPGLPVFGPAIVPHSGMRWIAGSLFARSALAVKLPAARVSLASRGVPIVLLRLAGNRFVRLAVGHFSFGQPRNVGDGHTGAMRHGIRK
jgi:hypothetical protein